MSTSLMLYLAGIKTRVAREGDVFLSNHVDDVKHCNNDPIVRNVAVANAEAVARF